MKRAFSILLLSVGLFTWAVAPVVFTGCFTPTQQKQAVNTIFSIQTATHAAYDAYVDAVIAGEADPKGLKSVSTALNQFNAATLVALDAVQFSTNAPAPTTLTILSGDLLNLIAQFQKKK